MEIKDRDNEKILNYIWKNLLTFIDNKMKFI